MQVTKLNSIHHLHATLSDEVILMVSSDNIPLIVPTMDTPLHFHLSITLYKRSISSITSANTVPQ